MSANKKLMVVVLDFVGSPSTVFLAVISVIIYPINGGVFLSELFRMFEIGFIHIIFEFYKRNPQTFYSSPAVSSVVPGVSFITPIKNVIINFLKSALIQSVNFICWAFPFSIVSFPATTAFYDFFKDLMLRDYSFLSAVTMEQPEGNFSITPSYRLNRSKPVKFFTSNIHVGNYITGMGNLQHI